MKKTDNYKICIVTGTRAEYGLLEPLLDKIKKEVCFSLQIVATGMHLSPEFGLTYTEIEKDGYSIDAKVEIVLSSDTSTSIAKSMGLAMISFSDVFKQLQSDVLVILGDRYEMLAAANVATILKIPIVHLHGGETTEAAFDEAIRHSITKMSFVHFTSTETYRKRVIQLGEHPNRVFNVGAIGIENIKTLPLWTKEQLEKDIRFEITDKTILVTYHPVTLENNTTEKQFKALLEAIIAYPKMKVIFTKANADTYGRVINKMIDEFIIQYPQKAIAYTSMGQLRYLSAMKYCAGVVGNSSSGIVETPSFKIGTINIGDRQKGRIQATSTINCNPIKLDIHKAFTLLFSDKFQKQLSQTENPYGEGNVSIKIIKILKDFLLKKKINLKKKFYDL